MAKKKGGEVFTAEFGTEGECVVENSGWGEDMLVGRRHHRTPTGKKVNRLITRDANLCSNPSTVDLEAHTVVGNDLLP